MKPIDFKVRGYEPTDFELVISFWLRSYVHSIEGTPVSRDVYFKGHQELVKWLLLRSTTIMACDEENPDIIYGFITFERRGRGVPIVHYIGVKTKFQQMGVGGELIKLIEDREAFYTHTTYLGRKLHIPEKWIYDPYKLLEE